MKLNKSILENMILEELKKLQEQEDEAPSATAADALVKGIDKSLPDFVTLLKKIASDPAVRKLALAGQSDDAGPADEALTVTDGTPVAAKDLTPTQKDIDMVKSLGDQMTNKWSPPATEAALSTGTIMLPSPGGAIPILTYANKFILDGHHRWSQVMMTNPDGKMAVSNLQGPALPNAEVALKATQLAIAGLAGNVMTKDTDINLLTVSEEEFKAYVRENISDEVLQLLVGAKKISSPDREEAVNYYANNLKAIQAKPPGAFSRKAAMPQADESGVSQGDVNQALQQGQVNFDDPELSDLQESKTFDRWRKLVKG